MVEPSATLDRDYDGEAQTLRVARQDVVAWLSARGVDEETKQRAALIVSELATNALEASPGRSYKVQVVLVDNAHAAIRVRNHATGARPRAREHWKLADHASLRGRGLAIVESLSEDVTVDSDSDQVVITARIRL